MHYIRTGYRGLSVLMDLNWDRLLYVFTLAFSLALGAYIGMLVL